MATYAKLQHRTARWLTRLVEPPITAARAGTSHVQVASGRLAVVTAVTSLRMLTAVRASGSASLRPCFGLMGILGHRVDGWPRWVNPLRYHFLESHRHGSS